MPKKPELFNFQSDRKKARKTLIFSFLNLTYIALKSHVQICEMHWKMARLSIFLSFWVCLVAD